MHVTALPVKWKKNAMSQPYQLNEKKYAMSQPYHKTDLNELPDALVHGGDAACQGGGVGQEGFLVTHLDGQLPQVMQALPQPQGRHGVCGEYQA